MYLWKGFNYGFKIPYVGPRVRFESNNLKSTQELPLIAQKKLEKEIEAGRIVGPFDEPPIEELRVSPIGIVPKKVPGEYRLIQHLSYPKGFSVNDAIPPEYCSVWYASFDHAIKKGAGLGGGCPPRKV